MPMNVQIDSREHKTEVTRIKKQLDQLGIDYFISKLYVGDYMSLDNPRLCIDRKKDLQELVSNVTHQHTRFREELVRAKEHGIKLIILVEHGADIQTLEDVYFWENPRAKPSIWVMRDGHPVKVASNPNATSGETLYKSLCTIRDRYGVDFHFCEKKDTGRKIVELLGGETDGE